MLSKLYEWLQNRNPGLPRRKDLDDNADIPPLLPERKVIYVLCDKRRMQPLAQVRKGWGKKLKLLFSLYICGDFIDRERWERQALQVCLHEMMHLALWDDKTITHSTDERSILFPFINGDNILPITWDKNIMQEAAKRIERIEIDTERIEYTELYPVLMQATSYWNGWIGREFFVLL